MKRNKRQMQARILTGAAAGTALLFLLFFPWPAAAGTGDELCKQAKSAVTVDRLTIEDGIVKASGTWQVSGNAVGALVEYRIDADRWASETHMGSKGTWEFSEALKWEKCGHYAFRVYAYPGVNLRGNPFHCLDNESSAPWRVDLPCGALAQIQACAWECGEGDGNQCVGSCTGVATSGVPPYAAAWGVNDRDYKTMEGVSPGPWTQVVQCAPGEKISFKVRDRNGRGRLSPPAELACGTQPKAP